MGMESYSIMLISKDVQIIKENSCWKLEGKSDYYVNDLNKLLENMKIDNVYVGGWIFEGCLEIRVFNEDEYLQGVEIKGCLSYLEGGVHRCYEIIKNICEQIMPVDIYILNEKVIAKDWKELYNNVCNIYYDKINLFKSQYNNIELKVTCGEFYKQVYKKKKWYYKLYYKVYYKIITFRQRKRY